MRPRRYVLTIISPDRVGIVAAVTSFIAEAGGSASHIGAAQADVIVLARYL